MHAAPRPAPQHHKVSIVCGFFLFLFETESPYMTQAGVKLTLLCQPLQC